MTLPSKTTRAKVSDDTSVELSKMRFERDSAAASHHELLRCLIYLLLARPVSIYGCLLQCCCTVPRITERQIPFCSGSRRSFHLIYGLLIQLDGRPFQYYCKQHALMNVFAQPRPLHVHASSVDVGRLPFKLITYV